MHNTDRSNWDTFSVVSENKASLCLGDHDLENLTKLGRQVHNSLSLEVNETRLISRFTNKNTWTPEQPNVTVI